jgi:hypothetical protein
MQAGRTWVPRELDLSHYGHDNIADKINISAVPGLKTSTGKLFLNIFPCSCLHLLGCKANILGFSSSSLCIHPSYNTSARGVFKPPNIVGCKSHREVTLAGLGDFQQSDELQGGSPSVLRILTSTRATSCADDSIRAKDAHH